jgi:MFS family permease
MNKNLLIIYVAVFLSTLGYGISFPLLSISLETTGVSGQLIGYNAAMPALGWLLGTLFLPRLQSTYGFRTVVVFLLIVASLSILGFYHFKDFWVWMLLRFLFGGSLGLFYRAIEFSLNGFSQDANRGRNIGLYSATFMLGIGIGATVQPEFGISTLTPFIAVFITLLLSIIVLFLGNFSEIEIELPKGKVFDLAIVLSIPLALMAVFAYGMFEDIIAYLMSVYALRNGLDETIAAYTLSAASIGGLLFPVPLGMLSDKIGRVPVILGCATIAMALSAVIPWTTSNATLFLTVLVIWAGIAMGVYVTALSLIGDKLEGAKLALANASFGMIYALGALIGPILNGFAIDQMNSQGLMVSSFLIFAVFLAASALFYRSTFNAK